MPDPLETQGNLITPVSAPRITVVSNVYHQIPGEPTAGPPATRHYRWLQSDESAYSRTVKIDKEWASIEMGHLSKANCSMIYLANAVKRLPSRKPTAEEIEQFKTQILEVAIRIGETDHDLLVLNELPVGEDMRIPNPRILPILRIRCVTGPAKYAIFLVPL